jgi:transposase
LRVRDDRRLTGTRYLWLKNPATLNRLNAVARVQFAHLERSSLKSARVWAIKDSFRKLWEYRSIPAARAFIKRWLTWAKRSRLKAMVYFAGIIERRIENILTYLTHRITNAVSEGLNAKIQWIKYASRGFRNRERFKLAILFHLGGLDLEPRA